MTNNPFDADLVYDLVKKLHDDLPHKITFNKTYYASINYSLHNIFLDVKA